MTNGEKIQTILDVDRDCTDVHGENGIMTFTVTQDFWNAEYQEPTKTCKSCRNYGSHHGVCDICKEYNCWTEKEPNKSEIPTGSTTKNDLGVDCIVDILGSYTDLDIPYKREIAENILANLPSVTPIRPKGHWIEVLGGCKCSRCDMAFSKLKETCADNYCPNCGSDNREVEE